MHHWSNWIGHQCINHHWIVRNPRGQLPLNIWPNGHIYPTIKRIASLTTVYSSSNYDALPKGFCCINDTETAGFVVWMIQTQRVREIYPQGYFNRFYATPWVIATVLIAKCFRIPHACKSKNYSLSFLCFSYPLFQSFRDFCAFCYQCNSRGID